MTFIIPTEGEAKAQVSELCSTFEHNSAHYCSSAYNEASVRKDFIDKFWIALGWDVNHDQQTNPYEQEVKVERPVATGGSQRRADYAYYLAPNFHDVRFFVEAKKPSVDIGTKENYFQLIRYGWGSDTPLAVLTDFEQFHILDCRYKPDVDTALNRALAKYHFTDYTKREKFAEIYWLFSREAVASGSLEKRAKELPKPRGKAVQRGLFPGGYQSIDKSFLAELDEYRKSLARNFKNHNPELDSETLTELTQRTLDRLVFLRFLEDKGIEPLRLVECFGEKGTVWEDFIGASRRLDGIYNGIIYRHHDILDDTKLRVDDNAFANICERLAHINSPYNFDAIPIHILGSIYERFLGKVIVATDKRAKVVKKPEVRKAKGVYYTPQYIVRYIVEHTVGKLIAGKTPEEIAKMRFADIACGSGSFLLGIFDQLLNYHGHYYNENPGKASKGDCIKRDGKLYLSLAKKREILLNNVYGVDIDAQAVEVCQLSLYLKLLEEETEASAQQYLLDFAHVDKMKKLLPDLSKNIRCGNSLIGPDYYENQQADFFNGTETRRINAFDWYSKDYGFGEIMAQGGFDAMIGNPPYGALFSSAVRHFLAERYGTPVPITDSFVLFMLKAMELLKKGGRQSFILPSTWLYMPSYVDFRKRLLSKYTIREVVHFRKPVFPKVTVETCIEIIELRTTPQYKILFKEVINEPSLLSGDQIVIDSRKLLAERESSLCKGKADASYDLFTRLLNEFDNIKKLTVTICGLTPYRKGKGNPPQTEEIVRNRSFDSDRKLDETYRRFIMGRDFHRYTWQIDRERWLSYGDWLAEPRYTAPFDDTVKIVIRQTADSIIAQLDTNRFLSLKNVHNLRITSERLTYNYLLGILNSKLITWWYQKLIPEKGRVFAEVKVINLKKLPIRTIDFNNKNEKAMHDRMIELVERMLELNKKLHERKHSEHERELLERQIDYTDRKIDRLVYELYGLTDDEKIIFGEATTSS